MTKRYELVWTDYTDIEMQESAYGDWVKSEDYDALQALNAELLEALEEVVQWLELGDHEGQMHSKASAAIAKARSKS